MIKHKKCTKCRWTNFVKSIDFLRVLWYCMSDVNVRKLRRKVMGNLKMAESLVAVYIYIHTHTLLLNKKINKFDIEKATRLSILC